MKERVNIGMTALKLYQTVYNLDGLTTEMAASAGLSEGFTHLLHLRGSRINQCAYCISLHTHDTLAVGEPIDRVSVLPAWRESANFNCKERVTGNDGSNDADFGRAGARCRL